MKIDQKSISTEGGNAEHCLLFGAVINVRKRELLLCFLLSCKIFYWNG